MFLLWNCFTYKLCPFVWYETLREAQFQMLKVQFTNSLTKSLSPFQAHSIHSSLYNQRFDISKPFDCFYDGMKTVESKVLVGDIYW